MCLTGRDGQRDVIECDGRAEVFADADRLGDRKTLGDGGELRCGTLFRVVHALLQFASPGAVPRYGARLASLADLVTPERRVVDVVLGHQRRGELVLETVRDGDDVRVVVGRAGLERRALQGRLCVEDRVLGVQVGRLRHGRVDLAGLDGRELLRDTVVGHDEDVL